MNVFVFDLLPYAEDLDHLKHGKELPWPLPRRHFKPEVAVRTYEEHLTAWDALERLGYDGVGFNEHHTSPREYNVYRVRLAESRARFEEAWEIISRAWTEEVFSYEGKFWPYDDVAIWPRPVQQPRPPAWVPVSGSKETIEWAGKHDIPITPGLVPTRGLREDIIRYYARCLGQHGHRFTPDHLIVQASAYVAESKARAVKEAGPYLLYFNQTLFSHGNISEAHRQRDAGYLTDTSYDYVRRENLPAVLGARERFRDMTMADVERDAELMPWGTPDEVIARIIDAADHAGASTVLVNMNRGAMPHEMFMHQIDRFGREVLPALQKHTPKPTPFL